MINYNELTENQATTNQGQVEMKKLSFFFIFLMVSYFAAAQFSRQAQDSIRQLTQQDYKQMMELTGVKSTRPGPSGTPGQPNSANTDESKAKQYTSLPGSSSAKAR